MKNSRFCVAVIINTPNDDFFQMIALINNVEISIEYYNSLNDFFVNTVLDRSELLIVSTDCLGSNELDEFNRNKHRLQCPVVVAGNYQCVEMERRAREAGVSCYLILPEESLMIESYIRSLRKSKENN